ncbi:MAG: hypothetical protein AAF074_18380, partial [Pseudomonadota bacterium]
LTTAPRPLREWIALQLRQGAEGRIAAGRAGIQVLACTVGLSWTLAAGALWALGTGLVAVFPHMGEGLLRLFEGFARLIGALG